MKRIRAAMKLQRTGARKQVEREKVWSTLLDGGEDLTTPALKLESGSLLFSKNYEPAVNGGYSRTGVFERFDGRDKPSDAQYSTIDYDAGTAAFEHGETVTGGTSSATGIFLHLFRIGFDAGEDQFQVNDLITGASSGATAYVAYVEVTSGSWRGDDAAGYLYVHTVTGTFTDDENITSSYGEGYINGSIEDLTLTSGTFVGNDAAGTMYLYSVSGTFQNDETLTGSVSGSATADGTALVGGAGTDAIDKAALMAAIYETRDTIGAVPGSGPIRGVMSMDGIVYAWRDNAGATEMDLYKATSSGWSQITWGVVMIVDTGTAAFSVGETATGGTSGATIVIKAVMVVSGSTGAGDQESWLIGDSITGTFQNNEAVTSAGGAGLANGAGWTPAYPAGGNIEYIVHNFTGNQDDKKIYGVTQGDYPGFEFDGTDIYPLPWPGNGVAGGPQHIAAHKSYLFMAYGSSVLHPGLGSPRDWSAISGAVEIATGDEVTGFAKAAGDILVMFNRSATYLLYGDVATEWDRKLHSDESGAIKGSVADMSNPVYLDDPGLTTIAASDTYGDFKEGTISKPIDPLLTSLKSSVACASRVKEKNQYRLFFTDGTGIIARMDRRQPAFTRLNYGKTVTCFTATEDTAGNEALFFGTSDDGYVYQSDVGRSQDGMPIEGYLRLAFWNMKSPRMIKRFLQAILSLEASAGASIEFTAEFDYGDFSIQRGTTQTSDVPEFFDVNSGGGFWDISEWGDFVWGAQAVGEAIAYLNGSGVNVGLLIRSFSASDLEHTLESVTVRYYDRGTKR